MTDDIWSAAHWCRSVGVRRGSLVGVRVQDAAYRFEVARVTHVGRCLVVGASVGTVYPRGRRGCGGPAVEASGDYEQSWAFASQLFAPAGDLLDAVVAWMERGG